MPEESDYCLSCFSVCIAPKPEPAAARTKAVVVLPGRKRLVERIVSAALVLVLVVGIILDFAAAEKNLPLQKQSSNAETADDAVTDPVAQTAGEATLVERMPALSLPQQVIATVVGQTALGGADSALPCTQIPVGSLTVGTDGDISTDDTPAVDTPAADTPNGDIPVAEPTDPEDRFTYTAYSSNRDKITITKYTGNSAKVVVPAVIDGKPVTRIAGEPFANKDRITEITFESDERQIYLWLDSGCMTNLSALKVVRLILAMQLPVEDC